MRNSKPTEPTKPELAILKLLWQDQELTARDIHQNISAKYEWSYSTVRTVLERMNEKGLVKKRSSGNANIYAAGVGKVALLGKIISDFSARVMELDAPPAAAFFADSKLLDDAELIELQEMLKSAKRED